MDSDKLQKILDLHEQWLNDGKRGERANLRGADLSDAGLRGADLRRTDLSGTDLSGANLSVANLSGVNLRCVDLSGADLRYANLNGADLSGAKGLLSPIDYLERNFEKTVDGYIAYKTFNGSYSTPEQWAIEPNSIITENVNFTRTDVCGCGINVAPLEWVKQNYHGKKIWKVLIKWEWLVGVCVPYNTDGKIRCERVQLLEIVG